MSILDADVPDLPEVTSSPAAPARLRARIMASGYKYQIIDEKEGIDMDLDFREDTRTKRCSENSSFLKGIIAILVLLCFSLLVALVFVVAHDTGGDVSSTSTKYIADVEVPCISPQCVETAGSILSRMLVDTDPCEDMYQLACGKWVKESIIPPGHSRWTMFSQLADENEAKIRELLEEPGSHLRAKNSTAVEKLKTWYQTCLDEETIESQGTSKLMELMTQLGFWTVSPPPSEETGWDAEKWSLQRSLVNVFKLQVSSFFSFGVTKDPKIADTNVIMFHQSGLSLSEKDEYTDASGKFMDGFMNFATKVGTLLGGNESHVANKMSQVYNLEKNLSQIHVPREDLLNPRNIYNKFNLSDFQTMIGDWVDIKSLLSTYFDGKEFSDNTEVIVTTPTFFSKLGDIVEEYDDETKANYMMWHVIYSVRSYLPLAFSRAALDLSSVESGVTSLSPRWQRCVGQAEGSVGLASSALFVDKYFSPASKEKVTSALQGIKSQFIQNLEDVLWLDDVTRKRLKVKAEAISLMVGYPDWILEADKLDERYDKLEVADGEILTNGLYAATYARAREIKKLEEGPDPMEWEMLPDEVNAYYNTDFNQVVVPAGILQPPYFSQDYPDALLFGTIGMIVGHELTHGFDTRGRVYDQNGILNDMWSKEAEKGFDNATTCMEEQYSEFELYGSKINGKLTVSENIADNGGVKLAWAAYLATEPSGKTNFPGLNFTDSQLFFLGFSQLWCAKYKPEQVAMSVKTDLHSLGPFRVSGVLSNMEPFSTAFSCKPGSPLNPNTKCHVW